MTQVNPIPSRPTVMKITPEAASDWLENRNISHNRNLSDNTAKKYAKVMSEGRWLTTHQGIAFDNDGFLIDGQHRLRAVVLAGCAVEMFVVPGCDSETFAVVDSGSRRQAGQLIRGKGGPMIAAAARFVGMIDQSFGPSVSAARGVYATHIDTDQVLAVVDAWPELREMVNHAATAQRTAHVIPSPHLAVLAQAARTQYADNIKDWVDGVSEGVQLEAQDPRMLLRNRFIRDPRTFQGNDGRALAYCMIVKAWNAFAVGAELRILRMRDDEKPPRVVA